MSKVMVALGNYVNQSRPQPNFAISEPDLSQREMEKLGFKQDGDFWVISRADAMLLFSGSRFDFDQHWESERKEREDAIPR